MQPVLNKQQEKSQRAQESICEAAIESLYAVGYGDTTLNKVADIAGVSKGALQHHFPTKEDLITATADRLLQRSVPNISERVSNKQTVPSVEYALLYIWNKMVNTPQYRALLEILNAARTDKELQKRISDKLLAWGKAMDDHSVLTYRAINGSDEDVKALMNMTRSFMRGLIIQERYKSDQKENLNLVMRWIDMLSLQLEIR
jgi:AcrR family transcriptional regulator